MSMRIRILSAITGCLLAFAGLQLNGAIIISDNYDITGNGSGFALGSGINSGINPPATRLSGSVAAGLRYIKNAGTKTDTAHSITNNTKFGIARIASDSSTVTLSTGTGPFDFGPALNTLAATPGIPVVYDITIDIANAAAGNQRCSFALSSANGTAGAWDFGIQLVHTNTADTFYTLYKRISAGASGGTAVNQPIGRVGTYSNEVSFLIRVTDAGAESTAFSSKVQVSTNNGVTWLYDSSADTTDLPSGFRFPSSSRFIFWDAAGGAGPVTYDNFSINFISGPTAGPRTWTGGGSDDNWSTAANWGGVVPTTGDSLIFNGTTRQANINDLSGLIVPAIAFNTSGFSLGGNPVSVSGSVSNRSGINTFVQELVWSSTAIKNWIIATNSELVLSNVNTVEVNGDHTILGGGTMRLKGAMNIGQATTANPAFVVNEGHHIVDGGTFTSRGGYRIGSLATGPGAQTILTNGATFSLTASGANLRVGDNSNSITSKLIVDNSTLTMAGANIGLPYAAGATAEIWQTGGTVSGATLNFNQNGAGTGTYTISNGVLETIQIKKTTSGGQSRIYFDNAILRTSTGASNAFFSGLNLATIYAGGLALDPVADVTIAQALTGPGGITKSNSGTVALTGANSFSGNTLVQVGKLLFPTKQTNSTSVQVANGAGFGVIATSLGSTLSIPSVNFAGASGSLNFDLSTFTTPTTPMMRTPSLSVSGPVVVNVSNGQQLTPGQIVLVDYDGTINGGFQFSLGSLPPGVVATLVDNTANSSIDLNITGVPGYRWTGSVNGDWDNSTQNWLDRQTSTASTFTDGFATEFLDGATTGNINITIFPSPSLLIVSNNTLPYAWTNGTIITTALRKYGSNSLTRIGGEADLITGIELNAGSYIVTNFFDATFPTILTDVGTGTGTFVKQGASKLTITSTNSSYDGAFVIQEGSIKLGNDDALGSTKAGTIIANGATLDLNNMTPGFEPVTVSGAGVNGEGAIIDSTTGTGVDTNLRDVTLAGDTTFGSPNGGRWDIRVRQSTGTGPGLKGNGYKLTKVGSGSVSIAAQRNLDTNTPYWQMNLGDILVSAGTLTFAESVELGNPSASLTVSPGATLNFYDLGLTNPIQRTITMSDAKLTWGGNVGDTNVINGGIQINGTSTTFNGDQATMIVNGVISGSSTLTLTANSPGTLIVNAVNTYIGETVISNGVFGGNGTLAGNLSVYSGTTAPGYNGAGTLTVNGNVSLASMTSMELNRSATPNSDRIVAGGTLSVSGTLNVVFATGAPSAQGGDTYQLFNKAPTGTFSSVNLPALAPGLSWNTSNLYVNGTISVTGTATQPTISSVSAVGGNLVLSGTGGTQGSSYRILTSTNVALPIANWVPVATNTFGVGGSFSWTNTINPSVPTSFFTISVP